jgi:hypothetical protein
MPDGRQPQSGASFSLQNGERLTVTHDDIDQSRIDVGVDQGSVEVIVRERIWYDWSERRKWNLGAGGNVNDIVDVDSDVYDGDQELSIEGKSVGANTGRYTFNSVDL